MGLSGHHRSGSGGLLGRLSSLEDRIRGLADCRSTGAARESVGSEG